jgi:hypothetical protein
MLATSTVKTTTTASHDRDLWYRDKVSSLHEQIKDLNETMNRTGEDKIR